MPKNPTIDQADSEIRETIGLRIKQVRQQRHLPAKTVASKLGMSRSALTLIESGRNNVNAVTLWKICCLLGCKIDEFFPELANGYSLSKRDLALLEREDKKVVRWAKDLFGDPHK